MHAQSQSGFLLVKRLRTPDVLPSCPTRLACRSAAFATEFQFQFCEAGENAGDPRRPRMDSNLNNPGAATRRPAN